MRWDRNTGKGCIPSVITGSEAGGLYSKDAAKNTKCAMNSDKFGAAEVCKYDSEKLQKYQSAANDCWKATQEIQGIDHLINHFCNPQLTADKMKDTEFETLEKAVANSCKKP